MPVLALRSLSAMLLSVSCAVAQAVPYEHPDGTPHWYEVVVVPQGIDWQAANAAAAARGGHLATITSSKENAFVFGLVDRSELWQQNTSTSVWEGPWLGGVQGVSSPEPRGGWGWAEPEPFLFESWHTGEPNNLGNADRLHFGGSQTGRTSEWADAAASTKMLGYVIEYDGALVPTTLGLLERKPRSFDGYTLFAPTRAYVSFLVDPHGRVVKWWPSQYQTGIVAYLLPNGNLLRTGFLNNPAFKIGGAGGIVEEFDWDGNLVWEYTYSSPLHCQHHDVERMPNGNVLMIAWELITESEAIAAGRDPKKLPEKQLFPDKIIEVVPTGPKTGQIVWEWRAWDHIIQDFDATKANYGKVEDHPERIDVNYIAYEGRADWMHANAVAYNWDLDQIAISVRSFDEVWIIDHSTTTAEAATDKGGRSGMGGRLLYRWGNPRAYRQGTAQDQKLFKQHDVHWVPKGLPGAGNLMLFNNGSLRPDGNWSSVDEWTPPTPDAQGRYPMTGKVWGPDKLAWTYHAKNKTDFFSQFVSGAQRQPNGNTVVCAGWLGETFEVTPQGETVWRYMNPIHNSQLLMQGHPGKPGQMVFRTYRYAPDFGAFANKTLTPEGPGEVYEKALLADGSRVDRLAELGETVHFDLISTHDADRLYLLGTSLTPGTMPILHRHFRAGYDALLPLTMANAAPAIFSGYFGRLDANGRARASFSIPKESFLKGLSFYSAFLVFDPAGPNGLSTFSNGVRIEIVK